MPCYGDHIWAVASPKIRAKSCYLETCLFARSRPDHTPVAGETAAVTIGALAASQSL